MTLSHRIKLIIPRFKWWRKYRKARAEFISRKKLFPALTKLKKEVKEDFDARGRISPNALDTQIAQGRYEMVCEVLRNVGK